MQYSCYNTLSMCPSSYTQYIHDSSGRQCNMVRSIVVVSLLLLRALALEQVKLSVVWLECTLLLGSHWLVYADMYYIYDTHVIKTLKVQFKNMRRGFKLFKLKKSCVHLHQYRSVYCYVDYNLASGHCVVLCRAAWVSMHPFLLSTQASVKVRKSHHYFSVVRTNGEGYSTPTPKSWGGVRPWVQVL